MIISYEKSGFSTLKSVAILRPTVVLIYNYPTNVKLSLTGLVLLLYELTNILPDTDS